MATKKKRGLGRGLDALLASSNSAAVPVSESVETDESVSASESSEVHSATAKESELRHLPVEWIQPGRYQPRRDIQPEALEELAASITVSYTHLRAHET